MKRLLKHIKTLSFRVRAEEVCIEKRRGIRRHGRIAVSRYNFGLQPKSLEMTMLRSFSLKILSLTVLALAVNCQQSFGQVSNTYVHTGAKMHVFSDDTMSVWGNSTNYGLWGSNEGGFVHFYGETWKNDNSATMPGAGTFFFQQPRPAPYANDLAQKLEGGHDWSSSIGCSFPDIHLENAKDLYLINDDSKTRDTFKFIDGHVIHDGFDFTIGDSDPGEILGYNETQFFVTNGMPQDTEGFLERENLTASDGTEDYPVGNAVGDYTPGSLKNDGTADDHSIRVFVNTYLDGRTGDQFNHSTVTRTWDVEERVDGGSDVTMTLQHNNNTEGYKFSADRAEHYITHYVGVSPNSAAQGNGADTTSNFKWDLLTRAKRGVGSSTGTITTGAAITDATMTTRSGLSAFSPYTKTIYGVNSIKPVVDFNTTWVNTDVSGSVKTNDIDPEGHETYVSTIAGTPVPSSGTVTVTTQNGSIEIDSLGNYTYTPDTDYTGKDSVVYNLCDDGDPQACEDEVLYLTILPVPDPSDPTSNSTVANPDEGISYGNPITLNTQSNDDDAQKDDFDFQGIEDPNNPGTYVTSGTINNLPGVDQFGNPVTNAGSLVVNTDGTVTYTPASGFVGTVTPLDYYNCDTVSNPNKACDTTQIFLSVLLNDPTADEPPLAGDDYSITSVNKPVDGDWLTNDTDPNVTALSDRIQINGQPAIINPDAPTGSGTTITTLTTKQGGTVAIKDDGSYTYTPPTDYVGPDQVSYKICDTVVTVQCDSATIYLLIDAQNTDFGDLASATGAGAKFIDTNMDGTPDGTNAVWAGSSITDEVTANTNANASADGGDDGLVFPVELDSSSGNTFKVPISSNKTGMTAYAQLQIDWDNDGTFDSTYVGQVTTTASGNDTVIFSQVWTPEGLTNATVNYRVRVSDKTTDFSKSLQENGEVEDYQRTNVTPVPVELINLDGQWKGNNAYITWSTASEVNNSHFIVQRSFDGVHFQYAGRVKTKARGGNATYTIDYDFTDYGVRLQTETEVYYRLIQTDYDGTTEVLGPVALYKAKVVEGNFNVYPNPSSGHVNISKTRGVAREDHRLRVTNMAGQVVLEQDVKANDLTNGYGFDMSHMPTGLYIIEVKSSTTSDTKRLSLTH